MDIVEKIKYLAKQNGTDMANIERCVGLGNSSIRRWSNNSPSVNKVLLVADYLNVSVDWLIRDELDITDLKNVPTENMPFHFNKKDNTVLLDKNPHLNTLLSTATEHDLKRIEHYLEVAHSDSVYEDTYSFYKCNTPSNQYMVAENNASYGLLKPLPVRGYVAAGIPIEAIDSNLNTIDVASSIDADYALIVSGNSMYPVIEDGEYVYVKSVDELNNNDIGVFYYNGSVTCKKFFKNDVLIKLISINPIYEDFIFYLDDAKNENINFKIEGKVILSPTQYKRLSN